MSFTKVGFGKILGDIFTRIQGQSLAPARQRRRQGGPGRTAPMAALEQRMLLSAFQNFDGLTAPNLPSGWTQATTGTASGFWESFSTGGVGNSGHVFLAGPNNVNDTTLTSPSIAIHAANTQLKFQHVYDFESFSTTAYDGAVLEISINGGAFTDILAAGGTFVVGGYNKTIDTAFANPLATRQAWGGSSGGFVTTVVNLPASAIGANVQLRWRYAGDNDVASPGWGIDSIELNDTDPDDQISEAVLRSLDTTVSNSIAHTRDVDMYAFDVTAGQTLVFDLDFAPFGATAAMNDSFLRLFDAAGTQLAVNDDANAPGETALPARESLIRHTFATAGRFYIGVSAFDNESYSATTGEGDTQGSNSGGYSLRIDRAPAVTVTMADTALRIGETSLVTFTFSEAVTGFANADVTVENGTLSTITQVGTSNVYTATFTPNANITDTTNLITVTGAGYTDATLNTGVNTSSPNYTIDTARPTATITMADTALRVGETSLVTFTFSEAVTGFTNADITVDNGTLSTITQVGSTPVWTATFTPTANVTDTSNLILVNTPGVTDLAGNTGTATNASPNYTIDTAAPTVVSVTRTTPTAQFTNASTVVYTVTFSEAVTGIDLADFAPDGVGLVTVGSKTFTGSGAVYQVTLSGLTGNGSLYLDVGTGYTDVAGNAGIGFTMPDGQQYVRDTVAPTATITMADTALKVGETSLVTFTFSEFVTGFVSSDVNLSNANGTLSALTTANGGMTWTGTFTPTANITDTTNAINLAGSQYTDLAGNAGSGTASSANYTIDTVRPTVVSVARTTPSTQLTNATSVTFTVTFSEAVTGIDLADFLPDTVGAVTVGSKTFTGSGAVYQVTLSGLTGNGSLFMDVGSGYTDVAGNSGSFFTMLNGDEYSIDQTRPTVAISMSDTNLIAGETSLVTFTFSEAVTGFTNADISVQNGTLSAVSSANGGVTWTGTFTPNTNVLDATNVIAVTNSGVTDLAGNTGTGTTNSPNYAIESFFQGTVQLMSDPDFPGQQMLVISGTAANDVISIARGPKTAPGTYVVTFNGVKQAPLAPTSRIVAFGRAGNDSIKMASSLPIAAHMFGDVGNDTLTGSAGADRIFGGENNDTINGSTGDNQLFGENGDDIISASSGSDVIYGGAGLDKISGSTGNNLMFGEAGNDSITGSGVLVGGNDNDTLTPTSSRSISIGGLGADILKSASKKGDILIGGTTDFDTNENALRSLHAEWASANPVQVRIDHLVGLLPGGANGSNFLISDAVRPGTVHNDGANDTLTNNFADDWLLPFAGDIRTKIIGRVNHL